MIFISVFSHKDIIPKNQMFPPKLLFRLIVPLVIEQILASTIGMADTVMVASVGEAAVSGVSLVDSVNILIIQVFSALTTGGAVITSQYLGRGDRRNASIAAKQLIIASFFLSFVLALFPLCFNRGILSAVFGKIENAVMESAVAYFYMTAASYPFLAVFSACTALFRSMNNSRVCMMISLMMNIINVGGNAIFIFGFGMGAAGAGLATLLSRIAGSILIVVLLHRKHNEISVEKLYRPEFNFSMIKNILKIGVPSGLENSMFQVGKLLLQTLVASFGTASIAANAVGGTLSSFSVIFGGAVGLSMITVVGRCVGAGEYGQAKYYTKLLMGIIYISNIFICTGLFFTVRPLVGIFNISAEATETAVRILKFYFIFCGLIWPLAFSLPNALRAAGDAKFTMVISLAAMWTCRIGFSYILALWFHLGLFGIWIAMVMDWVVRLIFFIWRFASGKWTKIKVID